MANPFIISSGGGEAGQLAGGQGQTPDPFDYSPYAPYRQQGKKAGGEYGYYDPNGREFDPTNSTDPFVGWLNGDAKDRSWRFFDDATKQFYQDNKQQAWGQYVTDQFGTQQTPLMAYAQGQYQRAYQDYLRANETNDTLMFTDTLDQNYVNSIRQSFYLQAPSAKGYNLQWSPNGRYTG